MSSGPPVLVLGASGFIGSALTRALVDSGRRVRAGVRSRPAGEQLRRSGAEPVAVDLLDPASLRQAASGCSVIFHAAGLNAMCPRDPGPLYQVNVQGTRNVVAAAAAAGVSRLVYTSSAATIGEAHGTVATADSPHRGWFLSNYERSKFLAERQAQVLAGELGVELVCVNPSSVQGEGRTGGTARWLIRYADGRLRWMVDTRVSLVGVADCTTAHLLAATVGVPGRRYLVSGFTMEIGELMEAVAEVTGHRYPVRLVPAFVALGAGGLAGTLYRPFSRRPPICSEMVRTLLHGHAYDGSRAAQELGFEYQPVADFIRSTLAWYSQQGLIRQRIGMGAG